MDQYPKYLTNFLINPLFKDIDVSGYLYLVNDLHTYGIYKYLTPCVVLNAVLPDIIDLINDTQGDMLFTKHVISSILLVFHNFPGLMKKILVVLSTRITDTYLPNKIYILNYINETIPFIDTYETIELSKVKNYVQRPHIYDQPGFMSIPTESILQCYHCELEECNGHSVCFHSSISSNL